MSNHCSVETAKALRDAGLVWRPKVGDWFFSILHERGTEWVVVRVGKIWPVRACPVGGGEWFDFDLDECLPLWRADDLLEELAQRDSLNVDYDYGAKRWQVAHGSGVRLVAQGRHEQPVEAAAQALLAVLRGEGGGQVKEGWTWLRNTTKWHYFVNGISLCHKWMTATQELEQGKNDSPDNCVACRRLLAKRKQARGEKESSNA